MSVPSRMIVLTRGYPPDLSATGNVIRNVVRALPPDLDVHVLTTALDASTPGETRSDGVRVLRGEPPAHLSQPRELFAKVGSRIRRFAGRPVSRAQNRQITARLDALTIGPEDVVLACTPEEILTAVDYRRCHRFRLVVALMEVLPQPPHARWLPSAALAPARSMLRRATREVIERSELVLALPTPYAALRAEGHSSPRVVRVEHPMLRDFTTVGRPAQWSQTPHLTYAGGFDLRSRNPEFMMRVLSAASTLTPIAVDMFTYGNCDPIVEREGAGIVTLHGPVPADVAMTRLAESDLLLTQGNLNSALTPSKIFDCVSTGRPIVHFSYDDGDPYLDYLERYDNGLVIRIGSEVTLAAQRVADFINHDAGRRRTYDEVRAMFPESAPEAFVDRLLVGIE